ncbi:MAG TPA: hypothetical protein VFZ25_11700 [Chloroflexota bacterium]|nr:hypothetical protein [Chloroflexota bacterium]
MVATERIPRVSGRDQSLRTPGNQRPSVLDSAEAPVAAILQLQQQAGNGAVARLVDSVFTAAMEVGQLIAAGERLLGELLQDGKGIDVNHLTNELFWLEHPELRGQKLRPGTPEAARWLRIRDEVARPLLRPKQSAGPSGGGAAGGDASAQPPGMAPAAQVAAESASGKGEAADGSSRAGTDDKYFTQNVGHYQDTSDAGKPRIWLYGSSGANVCNMTSLTMGLVSIAGEPEVRAKLIAKLRSGGMHAGASVRVGGKWLPLAEALDDSKVVDRIETIDLVTAVAIGKQGGYGDVTNAKTIARVAQDTGLATAEVATGKVHLSDPTVRESAARMLAAGKRVIAGTVNHYVYLVEIRDDGAIVHDPAGARVTPGLDGKLFLHQGGAQSIAREFFGMDAGRRETALRRVSTNPKAASVVNELPRLADLPQKDRAAALQTLERAHPEEIATGAANFYATSEFTANDFRLRVTLTGAPA